jgi:glycosyltransferase involved in cell wall biosynthesis
MEYKKILFTMSHPFNPIDGGVQRTTFKLGKYFTENGFDVSYYSLAGIYHVEPEFGKLYFPGKHTNDYQFLCKNLNEVLSVVNPDIVINQGPYEKIFTDVLGKAKVKMDFLLLGCLRNSLFSFKSNIIDILKRRYPQRVHSIVTNKVALYFFLNFHIFKHRNTLKRIIEVHDKFILLTPRNENELQYFLKDYPKNKVISIPNSIPSVLNYMPVKKKRILYVGSLNIYQKRVDFLIPFWEKIHKVLPDWDFFILGEGDQLLPMKQMIERLQLPRVTLVGKTNPESYYMDASIFVMPSAYEGFPNVLLEAQSYGLVPVVFNSYLSLGWILNEDEDSLFAKPFDVNELAEKTVNLALHDKLLTSMAHSALKNAQRFTIDKVGAEWLNLFEKSFNKR